MIYPAAYSTSPHEYLTEFQLRALIFFSKLFLSLCCFISVNDIAPSIYLLRPKTLKIILTLASCNQLISDLFGFTFKIYFKPNHLGFPDNSVGKESDCNAGGRVWFQGGVICWRRDRLPTPVFSGFPCCSAGLRIRLPCGRPGFSPWVEKIPWRRERLPTHFSILAWRILWTTVHGIAKSRTGLIDFHFLSNVLVQTTLPLDCWNIS